VTYMFTFRVLKRRACHKIYIPKLLLLLLLLLLHTHTHKHSKKDTKSLQEHYIQHGQTELHQTLPCKVQDYDLNPERNMLKTTLDTRPLLAMMLHTGTESTMFRNSKMSYRPLSCFTLSQEIDKNEGSYLKQEKNQTQLSYRLTRQSPPPPPPAKRHTSRLTLKSPN